MNELTYQNNQIEKLEREIAFKRSQLLKAKSSLSDELRQLQKINDAPLIRARSIRFNETPVKVSKIKQQKFMKGKLYVAPAEMEKFLTSAGWSDVQVLSTKVMNPKKAVVSVKFTDHNKLVELGGYLATVTTEQIAEDKKRRAADEAEAQKATQKAAAKK